MDSPYIPSKRRVKIREGCAACHRVIDSSLSLFIYLPASTHFTSLENIEPVRQLLIVTDELFETICDNKCKT